MDNIHTASESSKLNGHTSTEQPNPTNKTSNSSTIAKMSELLGLQDKIIKSLAQAEGILSLTMDENIAGEAIWYIRGALWAAQDLIENIREANKQCFDGCMAIIRN